MLAEGERPLPGLVGHAGLPAAHADEVLEGWEFTPYTPATLITRAALDQELRAVRERGWAADEGEFEEFVRCVAVRDASGDVTGLADGAARPGRSRRPAPVGAISEHLGYQEEPS